MAEVGHVCAALYRLGRPAPVDGRTITARRVAVPPEELATGVLDAANDAR